MKSWIMTFPKQQLIFVTHDPKVAEEVKHDIIRLRMEGFVQEFDDVEQAVEVTGIVTKVLRKQAIESLSPSQRKALGV